MSAGKWSKETRMKRLAIRKAKAAELAEAEKADISQETPAAPDPTLSQAHKTAIPAPKTRRRASDTSKSSKSQHFNAGASNGMVLHGEGEAVGKAARPGSEGHNRFTNELEDMPYSLRFARAKAMLDAGATYNDITAAVGLSSATIAKISKGEIMVNDFVAETMRKVEVNKLTLFGHRILDSIDGEVIKKAPLAARMMAYGISVDKRELLAGRPTQRSEFVGQKASDLDSEAARLEAEIQALRAGAVDAQVVEQE